MKELVINFLKNRFKYFDKDSFKLPFVSKKDLYELIEKLIPIQTDLIRVGSKDDGGYLIPKGFEFNAIFSPGVNYNDAFELSFANKGIPCYLADYSVDSNPTEHTNIHFIKKYIGYVRNNKNFLSLDNWITNNVGENLTSMLLQMDIEGWEYNNIINVNSTTLKRFDVMIIEFHDFHAARYKYGFNLFNEVFNKILIDFAPIHVHPNNCCKMVKIHNISLPRVLEFTFVNRSKINSNKKVDKIHHEYDMPNLIYKDEFSIEDWLKIKS